MAEAPASPNGLRLMPRVWRRRMSLTWRVAAAYGALVGVIGLVILLAVYVAMGRAVRSQIDRRVSLIAGEIGDIASGYMRAPRELRAFIGRYTGYDGVAYVFIDDANGKVVAATMKSFPPELLESRAPAELKQIERVSIRYRGRPVEEARAPIRGGEYGAVHLGIWREAIDAEVRKTVLPVAGLIAAVVCAGVALAVLLAHVVIQPIRRLSAVAGRLSTGDLDAQLALDANDEVGELARALDRMRASLKTAIQLGRAH